jgi:hypothetical protein
MMFLGVVIDRCQENAEMKKKLKYTIERFDHYYESVNTKLTVFLAFVSLNTGLVVSLINDNAPLVLEGCLNKVLLAAIFLSGTVAIAMLIYAALPYVKTKGDSNYYFGSVGKKTLGEFQKAIKTSSRKSDEDDLIKQVHALASGLTKKYSLIRIAGQIILLQIVLEIILTLNILL